MIRAVTVDIDVKTSVLPPSVFAEEIRIGPGKLCRAILNRSAEIGYRSCRRFDVVGNISEYRNIKFLIILIFLKASLPFAELPGEVVLISKILRKVFTDGKIGYGSRRAVGNALGRIMTMSVAVVKIDVKLYGRLSSEEFKATALLGVEMETVTHTGALGIGIALFNGR